MLEVSLENPVTASRFVPGRDDMPAAVVHRHDEGQLVLSLAGTVACKVPDAHWIVPPQCALWIPAGVPHMSHASANAQCYFLFVSTAVSSLPRECCSLRITPMLREMILELAGSSGTRGPRNRILLVQLLLDELARMPVERTCFPIPADPRLRSIAQALIDEPDDRRTVKQWSAYIGVSERTLSRQIFDETGMSFSAWRRQLHLSVALRALSMGRTVQQVSGDIGYESVTAFITMFKKALGTTPARYFANGTAESARDRDT